MLQRPSQLSALLRQEDDPPLALSAVNQPLPLPISALGMPLPAELPRWPEGRRREGNRSEMDTCEDPADRPHGAGPAQETAKGNSPSGYALRALVRTGVLGAAIFYLFHGPSQTLRETGGFSARLIRRDPSGGSDSPLAESLAGISETRMQNELMSLTRDGRAQLIPGLGGMMEEMLSPASLHHSLVAELFLSLDEDRDGKLCSTEVERGLRSIHDMPSRYDEPLPEKLRFTSDCALSEPVREFLARHWSCIRALHLVSRLLT